MLKSLLRLGGGVSLAITVFSISGCGDSAGPTTASTNPVAVTSPSVPSTPSIPSTPAASKIGHVFVIVLENKSYDVTFGAGSAAQYLATTLPQQGALLENYYSTGHASNDNYISMISGQAPNNLNQTDCVFFVDFAGVAPVGVGPLNTDGQAIGEGCVYPTTVPSLPDQFKAAGLSWKGYMEDMGNDPSRESATCGHPTVNSQDMTQSAEAQDQYATRHDPFVYFHNVIDDQAYCDSHVVSLKPLTSDLQSIDTTPNLVYITPNLCNDGHDSSCADGEVGGLTGINRFLTTWVPVITASPAFQKDGLLIILYDESTDSTSNTSDFDACCGEKASIPTNATLPPGEFGPAGGRVGAVLLSPFIRPGTVSVKNYNHYSMLRTIEDIFGFSYLGYADSGNTALPGAACDDSSYPCSFGMDVFSNVLPVFPARPN
jgi:hypothetical protein